MIRFFTASQFHNKHPMIGSTFIRVQQLLKYWPEADLYKFGENPEVLIFQKVYNSVDYHFPEHFEGMKILDMCDPDWLDGRTEVVSTINAVDAVTVSSEALAKFIRQLTDKPVIHVPDRFDLEALPPLRVHKDHDNLTAIWFGYSHNAVVVKPALKLLDELNIKLRVVSNEDPFLSRWMQKENYKYIKYDEDTIYEEMQKADFAIIPQGFRPRDIFKSNNRTVKSILAGLPVSHDAKTLRDFQFAENRNAWLKDHYDKTCQEYDVRKSVKQYQDIIEMIRIARDGQISRA